MSERGPKEKGGMGAGSADRSHEPEWSRLDTIEPTQERGPEEWRGDGSVAGQKTDDPAWASPGPNEPTVRREPQAEANASVAVSPPGAERQLPQIGKRVVVGAGLAVGVAIIINIAVGAWLVHWARSVKEQQLAITQVEGERGQELGAVKSRLEQVTTELAATRVQLSTREAELTAARAELAKNQQDLEAAQERALRAALGDIGVQACEQRVAELQRSCGKNEPGK
jgi:hypothetical protein